MSNFLTHHNFIFSNRYSDHSSARISKTLSFSGIISRVSVSCKREATVFLNRISVFANPAGIEMDFHDTQFLSKLAADAIVVIHFAFVLFVLLGQLLIMIGALAGWTWVRNFKFRLIHLGSILFVVAESVLGIVCPLTTLEKWLQKQSGGAAYEGDFIARWVHEVLFFDKETIPPWLFTIIYSLFGLLVLLTFIFAPPRRKSTPEPPAEV